LNTGEYAQMYSLESFYWWFVARRRLLDWVLGRLSRELRRPVIFDAGCGTGINYSVLAKYGETISSDSSEEALRFSRERGVEGLVRCRVEGLPFGADTFDLITALDMLEHIDDDLGALAELRRVAKKGGRLVITVPAYGFLWSEHDEALHHRRRYAASELRNKLTRAGFEVERVSYYITLLFFPILFARFAQSVFKKSVYPKTSHILLPAWLNSLLIVILDLERFLLRWINLPFGVSLVCLARKTT
jgi:SAM-dependent methyltransferase